MTDSSPRKLRPTNVPLSGLPNVWIHTYYEIHVQAYLICRILSQFPSCIPYGLCALINPLSPCYCARQALAGFPQFVSRSQGQGATNSRSHSCHSLLLDYHLIACDFQSLHHREYGEIQRHKEVNEVIEPDSFAITLSFSPRRMPSFKVEIICSQCQNIFRFHGIDFIQVKFLHIKITVHSKYDSLI